MEEDAVMFSSLIGPLRIESKIFRPHFIAVTMDEKLSSRRMIPEASLAT